MSVRKLKCGEYTFDDGIAIISSFERLLACPSSGQEPVN